MQCIYKTTPQGELAIHIFEPDTDEQTAAQMDDFLMQLGYLDPK